MTAPKIMPNLAEEYSCDELAKYWVKSGENLQTWREAMPEFLAAFGGNPCPPRIGSITDTWEEWGYDREDFERLNSEICGWIVSYSSAHGRVFLR
jgi:hypothetical protein